MHVRLFGSVLGALLVSSVGCELVSSVDRAKVHEAAGGAGTGGSPECAAATDCPDPGNECLTAACTAAGKCVPDKVAAGTPVSAQATGDCQQVVCDGDGATKSEADDSDLPVDGKECTGDTCSSGVPSNPALALDAPCGAAGALYCDGAGACVGCTADAECGAPTTCATPRCTKGVCGVDFVAPGTPVAQQTTGDCQEVQCDGVGGTKSVALLTDVVDDGNACTTDLCVGGAPTHPNAPSGTPCTSGGLRCDGAGACVACITGADCASLVCIAQTCVPATCSDHVKNAAETDVDCGGPDCGPCADGLRCAAAADCSSTICSGTPLTCQPPSCTDGLHNGAETGVDCGGGACPTCALGGACAVSADCQSGNCVASKCVKPFDDEPTNNTCDGASPEALPATVTNLKLPDVNDVDWFSFTATASDVGKVVHVVTSGSGSPPCDTVVEVFTGPSCAALTTLGGPSDDQNYNENWLSDPLPAAGTFWVMVSYTTFGFSSAPYTLSVSTQ
jgi:hypothetical protein